MVYRVFSEKKKGFDIEARNLKNDLTSFLGIDTIDDLRIINRYDVENISREAFEKACCGVFSEPQTDLISGKLETGDEKVFAVEYLPGQFDQRADSAAQCIELMSAEETPTVKSAKVYVITGRVSKEQIEEIKKYVINPVEAREADLGEYTTLKIKYPVPKSVPVLDGFIRLDETGLNKFLNANGLAMDIDDLRFCQSYFMSEDRDPTMTEIKMIDTYWSDHCRHTTFLTTIDNIEFNEDDNLSEETYDLFLKARKKTGRKKPVCLMEIATGAMRYLKFKGILSKLDESEEIGRASCRERV